MAGALDGIRVLDLSTLVQGPQAAEMLHDLGAEVIKIELPGIGDVGRHVDMLEDFGHTSVFIACNRGKRSVTLDLRVEAGREAFLRLVETSDVVLSNFKPGTLDEWGLSYDKLAEVNPRIIWAAGSFLGPVGPDAQREGADIAGQASGGVIASSGYDGGPLSTYGSLRGRPLRLAEPPGPGLLPRCTPGSARAWASESTSACWAGKSGCKRSSTPICCSLATRQGARTAGILWSMRCTASSPLPDGYIAMAGCPEHLWPGMCRAIERLDMVDHPTFNAYFVSREVAAEMRAFFIEVFETRTTEEWSKRLEAEEQRFCPVRSHSEVVASDQPYANGYLGKADHDEWGEQTWVGCPITMSDTPTRFSNQVAELGQHTEEVLLEAGAEWEELEQWREAGAW